MSHPHHAIARAFFAAMSAGDVPDDLLTPDMTAWTTSGGAAPKERFQAGIRMLAPLFDGGLTYIVDTLTAEEDRVAAEVRSRGTFVGGAPYDHNYVFMLRIRDGRIAAVAEHNNPKRLDETLMPLIREQMAKATSG